MSKKKLFLLINLFFSCSVFSKNSVDLSVTGKIMPKPMHYVERNEKNNNIQLINKDLKLKKIINLKSKKDIIYQDEKSSLIIYKKLVKLESGVDYAVLDFYY